MRERGSRMEGGGWRDMFGSGTKEEDRKSQLCRV